jgi:hypothetical protein
MRDYTKEVVQGEHGSTIRFRLDDAGSTRLALVKTIKDVTGMGLKDSKDFVWACETAPVWFNKRMSRDQIDSFRHRLENCQDIVYELEDTQANRNRKLIGLGLCEKDEVIDQLSDHLSYKIIACNRDKNAIVILLAEVLSHIDEKTLVEIFNSQDASNL